MTGVIRVLRTVKVVLNTGEEEVLVTSLFDSQVYTCQDLKEVYALRWGIESGYGYLKEELQPARFSGIRQIRWGMLKYRVVRLFLEKDSRDILTEPENLFEKHLEPVRPGRKYDRKKRRPPNGKFYTLTILYSFIN